MNENRGVTISRHSICAGSVFMDSEKCSAMCYLFRVRTERANGDATVTHSTLCNVTQARSSSIAPVVNTSDSPNEAALGVVVVGAPVQHAPRGSASIPGCRSGRGGTHRIWPDAVDAGGHVQREPRDGAGTPGWEKEIVWDLIQDNEALKGSKAYWRLNDLRF